MFLSIRLTKANGQDWEVETWTEDGKRKKYYLNVCHSLNSAAVSKGCSPMASVCSTTFDNTVKLCQPCNLAISAMELKCLES